MMCEDPVQFELSTVLDEPPFTDTEIHELLSSILFQPDHISRSLVSKTTFETNRSIYSPEERKIRRMISNRESARRSRLRKKMHMENLYDEVNRHRTVNRHLKNQLYSVTRQCLMAQRESDRLRAESFLLQQRLAALTQILHPMQFQ